MYLSLLLSLEADFSPYNLFESAANKDHDGLFNTNANFLYLSDAINIRK